LKLLIAINRVIKIIVTQHNMQNLKQNLALR